MEEIQNERKSKQMEIGQIFFADIMALEGIGIFDLDADYAQQDTVDTITCGGDNCHNYVNPYIKNEDDIMLVALKYIGNSLFEEMSTGEKIRVGERGITFIGQDGTHSSYSIPGAEYTYVQLDYEDYIVENPNIEHISKYEYLQLLQNIMEKNIEYPLILAAYYYCQEISEESKQIYLLHSDEERKNVIQELKKLALLDSKEANERIANSIEKLKTLTSEDVDMAYLDNQLYDFEHKGRTM